MRTSSSFTASLMGTVTKVVLLVNQLLTCISPFAAGSVGSPENDRGTAQRGIFGLFNAIAPPQPKSK